MPIFTRDNASIYFEETGKGEPVVTIHGLTENTTYWSIAGVTGILSERYRVISMDMRGHGRTIVQGDPSGFDVDTVGGDVTALADHLNLGRFHLIGHSTGGFVAARLAIKDSHRFATLILTNSSSATSTLSGDPETLRKFYDTFGASFEKRTWDEILAFVKKNNEPLFRGIVESPRCDELLSLFRKIMDLNDRSLIASFVRSFFRDPDPKIEGLQKIGCPVLVIIGEKDDLFLKPSRLMAREIPGAKYIEYKGIGHITALEAPERLAADMIDFMGLHPV
jgi:pimeloyl-ACP methyl ester carboxylesterase